MPKLTLSADSAVIGLAKKMASRRGTSVSNMFREYIYSMEHPVRPVRLPPLTRTASGLIRLPRGKSDRKLIEDALAERYHR